MRGKLSKLVWCSSVSVLALANGAIAQQEAQPVEQAVVTGTRIVNGAEAPTPVTAVGVSDLLTQSPLSIPNALLQLPQFASTVGDTSRELSNGKGGSNAPSPGFNLYGLGTIRTLVLLDGNRIPGTSYDTTVNSNMLPQMLVSRVDVVTGGASAVYGSDAVAGVVNYVLDHNFNGFKGLAQGGISTYGDATSFRLGGAVGFELFNRGHFEASAEYKNLDSIPDAGTRPYGLSDCALVGNGTSSPYTMACNMRLASTSSNGLIVNGPAKGKQFSADGKSIIAFDPGTPTATGNLNTGGDGGYISKETLLPASHTFQSYARFDYDLSKSMSVYVEGRLGIDYTIGASQGYSNTNAQYPIWIYSGNPFLTAAEQSTLFPNGSTAPVDIARYDNDLMRQLTLRQVTDTNAVSVGVKGTAFDDFTWDAHFTHGNNHVSFTEINNLNSSRLYAALDAVKDPVTGNTVCNVSLTAPGAFPGCTPINLFGQGNASQAAMNYVFGNTWWVSANSMDDAAANLTGTVFEGWAGPIKAAVGLEYRSQGLNVTTSTPDDTFNPQYLRLAPYGTYNSGNYGTAATNPFGSYPSANLAWFKEVQSAGKGNEGISEANVELDAPILKNLPFVELMSLNGAYRYTQYKTSGEGSHSSFSANTWKVGLVWSVNDDVRLRLSQSRDMRAPTLWDLYQQQAISSAGVNDPLTRVLNSGNTVTGGNPNLKPEVSNAYTAGVVVTPHWIPNLTASVDYFHIKINNAIGSVSGLNATIFNLCQSTGAQQYCGLVVRPGAYNDPSPSNFPTLVYSVNQNIAMQEVGGFNTEVSYSNDLSSWSSMPGVVNLRLFWTHQDLDNVQSVIGGPISNNAGVLGVPTSVAGVPPKDNVNLSLGYSLGNFSANIVEQYIGSMNWTASVPPLAVNVPNMPKVPAYALTNVNLSYGFTADDVPVTAFLSIRNFWNNNGPLTGGYVGNPGMLYPVPAYADVIGRYFTVGVRVNM